MIRIQKRRNDEKSPEDLDYDPWDQQTRVCLPRPRRTHKHLFAAFKQMFEKSRKDGQHETNPHYGLPL
jgi:hypothetical protein